MSEAVFWGVVGVYLTVLALVVGVTVPVLVTKSQLLILLLWTIAVAILPLALLLDSTRLEGSGQSISCGSFYSPENSAIRGCAAHQKTGLVSAIAIAIVGLLGPILWLAHEIYKDWAAQRRGTR